MRRRRQMIAERYDQKALDAHWIWVKERCTPTCTRRQIPDLGIHILFVNFIGFKSQHYVSFYLSLDIAFVLVQNESNLCFARIRDKTAN